MVKKGKSKYCITGFPNVHELEIRSGKYGDFLGCTRYFDGCNYTEPLASEKVKTRKYKRKTIRPSKANVDNLKKQTKRQAELREKRKPENKIVNPRSSSNISGFTKSQNIIISKTEDIICPSCGSAVNFNGKCSCS